MNSEYLEAYLSDELSLDSRVRIEEKLERDSNLRESFLQQQGIDAALRILLAEPEDGPVFNEAVIARLESEGAGGSREFSKSILTEIIEEREGIRPIRWPDLIKAGALAAAASIALMFLLQTIIFREGVDLFALRGGAGLVGKREFVAKLEQSDDARWSAASIGSISNGGWVAGGPLELEEGNTLLSLNSGASLVVEGPAVFSLASDNRIYLKSGRVTATVPPEASGFTINTPLMQAVDIGTRFGVSVDSEGVSELHVMEGEVLASRPRGQTIPVRVVEGLSMRADQRVNNPLAAIPYAGEQFIQVVNTPPTRPTPALEYLFDGSEGNLISDTGANRRYDVDLFADRPAAEAPGRGPGKRGSGLVFSPGELVETALNGDFKLDSAHTISFWVQIPARFRLGESSTIASYGDTDFGWKVRVNRVIAEGATGAVRIEHDGGFLVGTTDIADGNWHHVAYRFLGTDGSGDPADLSTHVHLFVDGQAESVSALGDASVESGRARLIRLGELGREGFDGRIDEVRIFTDAISTPRLQELAR